MYVDKDFLKIALNSIERPKRSLGVTSLQDGQDSSFPYLLRSRRYARPYLNMFSYVAFCVSSSTAQPTVPLNMHNLPILILALCTVAYPAHESRDDDQSSRPARPPSVRLCAK